MGCISSMIAWRLMLSLQAGISEKSWKQFGTCQMNLQPGIRNMRALLKQMFTFYNFLVQVVQEWRMHKSSQVFMGGLCYEITSLTKSHQPRGKSYILLKESSNDPLIQAKVKFTELITSKLNKFLREFQTHQSMMPFLRNILKNVFFI